MAKSDGRFQRAWWPTLDSAETAKKAAHQGAYYALFIALVLSTITTLNLRGITDNFMNLDAWAYVDATMFLLLGVFILRMSRTAALLALALYIAERAYGMANGQNVGLVAIVFGLFFVNAVRGTSAYRQFTVNADQTVPSS
jgi:hypothetical protein